MVVSKHAVAGVLVIVLGTVGAQLFRRSPLKDPADLAHSASSELTWRSPDVTPVPHAEQVAPFPQRTRNARPADSPALLSLRAPTSVPQESPLVRQSAIPLPIRLDTTERCDPIADPLAPQPGPESVRSGPDSSEPEQPASVSNSSQPTLPQPVPPQPGLTKIEHHERQFLGATAATFPTSASESQPPGQLVEADPPVTMRPHVVRDGDSLEELAERYLGSRRRWSEIYEANLELLSDPELLPIGKTLRIPRHRRQNTELVPINTDGLQALRQSAWPDN